MAVALTLALAAPAAAATFTVNDGGDAPDSALDGTCDTNGATAGTPCTLRAAIQEANFTSGADNIRVDGALNGTTVTVASALPTISDQVSLDACAATLPDSQVPCLGIAPTGTVNTGLTVAANNSAIRGLAVTGFSSIGVEIDGNNAQLQNMWFGINAAFTTVGQPGVALQILGNGTHVGGTVGAPGDQPADRTIFAGTGTALRVFGGDNTVVEGSYFGLDIGGTATTAARNANNIQVVGPVSHQPTGTVIGGTVTGGALTTDSCDGACNVISHTTSGPGIELQGGALESSAASTSIRGNVIGGGSFDFDVEGNTGPGIDVGNAGPVTIGGTVAGAGNVIEDNGTSNGGAGIRILGGDNTVIQGNVIGTDLGGDVNRGNDIGISVGSAKSPADTATGTVIGGTRSGNTCDGACNVIVSSEHGSGVFLSPNTVSEGPAGSTTIKGNMIGVNGAGSGALPNSANGVDVGDATPVTIGGAAVGDGNVIGSNKAAGISGNASFTARNNILGVSSDRTSALPNVNDDAVLNGGGTFADNLVGGDATHPNYGLRLTGTGASVTGNTFGLGIGGQSLGFRRDAIAITGSGNTIGGAGAGNVIGNSDFDVTPSCCTAGVDVSGANNVLQGNAIGVGPGGVNIGNKGAGIRLFGGASGNLVGGDTAAQENVISNNGSTIGRDAVEVRDAATTGNTIARNVGSGNADLFIDLLLGVAGGFGNPPTGPHGGAQAPTITTTEQSRMVGTAPAGATVRAFRTAGTKGDVMNFLGSATAAGDGSFVVNYGAPVAVGDLVTASQTTASGTSEMPASVASVADPPPTGGGGGSTGGGGGGGGGSTPAQPAKVTGYGIGPASFMAASRGGSIARTAIGTTVRYTLSEAATVTFTVERVGAGRRVGTRCRAPSRANSRRPRCDLALAGSFSKRSRAGANRLHFSGRLHGRKLAPGRYKLVAVARDSAGLRSAAVRRAFRIVTR